MVSIQTKLTTSGNSRAVRLPKQLLKMSGLSDNVQLEAKKGKIIISNGKHPREGWAEQIQEVLKNDPAATNPDPELVDWDMLSGDNLEDEH
jgi:antitoxin component of MazEF toxin-antitoxin module